MIIYFRAFIGTCLLMIMAGICAVTITYLILMAFHASHNIELVGEGITILAVLLASIFVFKITVETERDLANENSDIMSGLDR